jgi:hypothetical protein
MNSIRVVSCLLIVLALLNVATLRAQQCGTAVFCESISCSVNDGCSCQQGWYYPWFSEGCPWNICTFATIYKMAGELEGCIYVCGTGYYSTCF